MPLDPQAKAVLDQMAAAGAPPIVSLSPADARAMVKARPRALGPSVYRTEDRFVAAPAGAVPIRIYTPVGNPPFPALVWFHGGGWIFGDLDSTDGTARQLCAGAGCVVISVDYHLAPEAKFPIPAEDCYAATVWAAQNGPLLGIDTRRIAVGGDSAGGNLAAAVTLMARDRSGPRLAYQLLVYPATEHGFSHKSYQENAEGYLLTTPSVKYFWGHYLARPVDADNPYAAPMKAKSLRSLPPALVVTAEFDPLRDEGEAYAQRLQREGVAATCTRYDGMIHGFFGMSAVLDKARQAVQEAGAALRQALAEPAAPNKAA